MSPKSMLGVPNPQHVMCDFIGNRIFKEGLEGVGTGTRLWEVGRFGCWHLQAKGRQRTRERPAAGEGPGRCFLRFPRNQLATPWSGTPPGAGDRGPSLVGCYCRPRATTTKKVATNVHGGAGGRSETPTDASPGPLLSLRPPQGLRPHLSWPNVEDLIQLLA